MSRMTIGLLSEEAAQALSFGLEDDNKIGVLDPENEYTFYAKIEDAERIKRLGKVVTQEQWQIKVKKTNDNLASGSIRVRRIVEDGQERFVRTTKVDGRQLKDGLKESQELNFDSNAEEFAMFKSLSEGGMHKDRVTIPTGIDGLAWEVDLFILEAGQYAPWCKIDLEVSKPLLSQPPLPPVFTEVIRERGQEMDPASREIVNQIYAKYFITRNHQVVPIEGDL